MTATRPPGSVEAFVRGARSAPPRYRLATPPFSPSNIDASPEDPQLAGSAFGAHGLAGAVTA